MKIRNLFKVTLLCLFVMTFGSCSSDDDIPAPDDRSFITDATIDFFINRDATVNIIVTGRFTDTDINSGVIRRGFVYGTTSNPEVNANNTVPATGSTNDSEIGTFYNLDAGQTIFVRGFFEYADGTFFYGNEIQTTTDVDATNTRSITMVIDPDLISQNSQGITPELKVTALEKESPIELGFEYSINNDFSNSTVTLKNITGNVGVISYSKLIEGLTSNTVYYFRPYAKYADGTITNGGNSIQSFTTN